MKIYQETANNTGYQYSYDRLGNITVIKEKQPNGDYEITNSYEYDYFTDDLELGINKNTIIYEYGDSNWKDE